MTRTPLSADPMIFALPSKGRLKEQCEAFLASCGFRLDMVGGDRGYRARLDGLPGAEVWLLSASDIAQVLDAGEVHLGVTGEDLLRERAGQVDERVMLLRALGFGRADLVVAAPKSWIDVSVMADIEEVAHQYLARNGRRLRVATKYVTQTRRFFAAQGIADYRIVESSGATEGAPAAGVAELVVDITTTGATLVANHLKILRDGVILRSQAHLAASLRAAWSVGHMETVTRLLSALEAKAAGRALCALSWPKDQDAQAVHVLSDFIPDGVARHTDGVLIAEEDLFSATRALAAAKIGPVSVTRPDYVFQPSCPAAEALQARLAL